MPRRQVYTVLLADDSEDDRFFLRKVIGRFPRFRVIGEATDGEETVAYLSGKSVFANRHTYPFPDLLLLDLKMPRKTGFEVLHWLRVQSFHSLTVVVLSSSPLQTDIDASLALGAHGYWTKTAHLETQNLIAQEIETLLDERLKHLHSSAVSNETGRSGLAINRLNEIRGGGFTRRTL